jgi:hypothetical protein
MKDIVVELASAMMLGALLERARERWGAYQLLDHWQQGEFHHDVVLGLDATAELPGGVVVVATNCNGGVKEVLWFDERPDQNALWHDRCPNNPEFSGVLPEIVALARTSHWFDPCELLRPEARSEYREEFRVRQCGGGWLPKRS